MLIRVLGAAAGGGFPQWNCNCANCHAVRHGSPHFKPRTQSSIAVSADGLRWILCNASPDLHRQIDAHPALQPHHDIRQTPIVGVILVDGQIDHATGLLLLRENPLPLEVWTTDAVREDLTTGLPFLNVLTHYCGVQWQRINTDGVPLTVPALPGIRITAIPVDGKPGPYSPHRQNPILGDNIALSFTDEQSNRSVLYAPGLGAITPAMRQALRTADCVMVDGTFWTNDEMITQKVSTKRAREIGHLPQSGEGGMIEVLSELPKATRRILIHINNTNPILNEASLERAQLNRESIEVAYDGMEIQV